jgi:NAD(P)H-hydrate repair Nnr-like enzyme with NAD(P)H-hydrate epimerase domain
MKVELQKLRRSFYPVVAVDTISGLDHSTRILRDLDLPFAVLTYGTTKKSPILKRGKSCLSSDLHVVTADLPLILLSGN